MPKLDRLNVGLPMRFEFATATRIIYGPGTIRDVPAIAAGWGTHAFIITGMNPVRANTLINLLSSQGITCTIFQVTGEPTIESISSGTRLARNAHVDLVVAIGGGSVIDTGKAIAALLTNPGELSDYVEVIGQGKEISIPPVPFIAIPTTAGTGAETTRNAVIASPQHCVKVSMRSSLMLPRLAVIDPELTYSLPPTITASTGLDAMAQLIEAFITKRANPFTDGLCREGLMRAARSLQAVCSGSNPKNRADMCIAALFSGLALANAGLGAVHGFAAPIGGLLAAPHGMVCARLLPLVTQANIQALNARMPYSEALARYEEIARILTDDSSASLKDSISWIDDLCRALDVPGLAQFGMQASEIPNIVKQAQRASSMKGNPIELTDAELTSVLERAL